MGRNINLKTVEYIKVLREKGATLNEIKEITKLGYGTVFKYIKDVPILPEYQNIWKRKRGGSKNRSLIEWEKAQKKAKELLSPFSKKDTLLVLVCLYWGEGNKTELNIINSDPALVKVFVTALETIGVKKKDLKVTLRIYEDIDKTQAIIFWSKVLQIPQKSIAGVNILEGKKVGKLKYGMCRVRVKKGAPYFKLIMSMIDLIKVELDAAVVQWIERETPKL